MRACARAAFYTLAQAETEYARVEAQRDTDVAFWCDMLFLAGQDSQKLHLDAEMEVRRSTPSATLLGGAIHALSRKGSELQTFSSRGYTWNSVLQLDEFNIMDTCLFLRHASIMRAWKLITGTDRYLTGEITQRIGSFITTDFSRLVNQYFPQADVRFAPVTVVRRAQIVIEFDSIDGRFQPHNDEQRHLVTLGGVSF